MKLKKSEIYKMLQELVLDTCLLSVNEKLQMLRVLFAQEDYALYGESLEAQEEPLCEQEESEV